MKACEEGHIQVADMLIRNGANLEARRGDRMTCLEIAEETGNSEVRKMLLSRRAIRSGFFERNFQLAIRVIGETTQAAGNVTRGFCEGLNEFCAESIRPSVAAGCGVLSVKAKTAGDMTYDHCVIFGKWSTVKVGEGNEFVSGSACQVVRRVSRSFLRRVSRWPRLRGKYH